MPRLVCDEDAFPTPAHDADDPGRFEAEYRQALLVLAMADYELEHGPNAYTRYVKEHRKRPPPAEATAIAGAIGMQVKADDGRWYPIEAVFDDGQASGTTATPLQRS